MELTNASNLSHDPNLGEVDPRTFPLLACIKFACETVGDTQRTFQANQLVHAIDVLSTREGQPRVRVFLTKKPGVDPRDAVEVHLQPISMITHTTPEDFMERMQKCLPDLKAAGLQAGWTVLE